MYIYIYIHKQKNFKKIEKIETKKKWISKMVTTQLKFITHNFLFYGVLSFILCLPLSFFFPHSMQLTVAAESQRKIRIIPTIITITKWYVLKNHLKE